MYVKNFEIVIRLLGGLLSGYELNKNPKFLKLATNLANRLLPAYNSPTGMPYKYVNLKTGQTKGIISGPAEVGTAMLEFGTLSKLTGNPVYYNKAKKAVKAIYSRRSRIGLVGSHINILTGKWTSPTSTIGAGTDSYYEYLVKAWKLFGDKDFKKMFKTSMKSINKYLADSVSTGFWYGEANMNTGKITGTSFGALTAYFPAVLALGGDLKRAKMLETSCFKMWEIAGVEPEAINFMTMEIINPHYYLRPENLESAYYLYHYTHNPIYLKRGKKMIESILKYCRTKHGFAVLKNVKRKDEHENMMESYLLAETFKYAYLLFAPASTINFNHIIFNTEGHPLSRF